MEPVICFEMLYPGLDPVRKIKNIAEIGFRNVEFWGSGDKDIPAIASACGEHEVRIVNFSGHRRGSLVSVETHELLFSDLIEAVSAARKLNCPVLMLLTNELGEGGRVKESYAHIPPVDRYDNVRRGLEEALRRTPNDINLVLEPLNTRIDHPGYFLEDMKTAASLVSEIGQARLKILADLYHLGVMGVDLEAQISEYIRQVGYIHIADFPGRHEPGTGSADWPALLKLLKEIGYGGWIGFEYSPLNDSDESLRKILSLWERVVS